MLCHPVVHFAREVLDGSVRNVGFQPLSASNQGEQQTGSIDKSEQSESHLLDSCLESRSSDKYDEGGSDHKVTPTDSDEEGELGQKHQQTVVDGPQLKGSKKAGRSAITPASVTSGFGGDENDERWNE